MMIMLITFRDSLLISICSALQIFVDRLPLASFEDFADIYVSLFVVADSRLNSGQLMVINSWWWEINTDLCGKCYFG